MPTVQSYTINFQVSGAPGADGYIKFESDTDKTTFYPGDTVPYRIFLVGTLLFHTSTHGTIAANGSGSKSVTDEYVDVNGSEVSLDYPVASGLSMSWTGKVYDENGAQVSSPATPTLQADNRTLVLDAPRYGILKLSYSSTYSKYELSGVPTNIPVAKVFAGASA